MRCLRRRAPPWIALAARAAVAIAAAVASVAAAATPARASVPSGTAPGTAGDSAAARPVPLISTTGACPEAEAVTAAIAALLPHGGLDSLPPSAEIEVSDIGETYRVTVRREGGTWARVYRDAARNCQQRARFAAVFIVLTLVPPELLVDSPAASPTPEPAPAPPPPSPPAPPTATAAPPLPEPARARFWFELATLLDAAPPVADTPRLIAPGVELRAGLPLGHVTAVAAVAFEPRAAFDVSGLEARQWRVPLDLGARVQHPVGSSELAAELGVFGAVFRAEGVNPPTPKGATRLELGARAGVVARLGWAGARLAPVVGVHAVLVPSPYELSTTPAGVIGHTPSLWVGATVGLRTALF